MCAEWEYALNICKNVIPVLRLGEPDLLPPELRVRHYVDMRKHRPYDDAFAELLSKSLLFHLLTIINVYIRNKSKKIVSTVANVAGVAIANPQSEKSTGDIFLHMAQSCLM